MLGWSYHARQYGISVNTIVEFKVDFMHNILELCVIC